MRGAVWRSTRSRAATTTCRRRRLRRRRTRLAALDTTAVILNRLERGEAKIRSNRPSRPLAPRSARTHCVRSAARVMSAFRQGRRQDARYADYPELADYCASSATRSALLLKLYGTMTIAARRNPIRFARTATRQFLAGHAVELGASGAFTSAATDLRRSVSKKPRSAQSRAKSVAQNSWT